MDYISNICNIQTKLRLSRDKGENTKKRQRTHRVNMEQRSDEINKPSSN